MSRQTGDLATQASALLTLAMGGTGSCSSGEDASFELIAQARAAAAEAGDYHMLLLTATNESHLLEGIGAHQRAAGAAKSGVVAAQKYGLARTAGTFLSINLAEPLVSLGRWDEAAEVIEHALDLSPVAKTRASLHHLAGTIAVARGDLSAGRDSLTVTADLLACTGYEDQLHLPGARLEVELRHAEGRLGDALAAAEHALGAFDLQSSPRYAWPLLVFGGPGMRRCGGTAQGRGSPGDLRPGVGPAHRAGRRGGEAGCARPAAAGAPADLRLRAAARWRGADRSRADTADRQTSGQNAADAWRDAAQAWDGVSEPYPASMALFRLAEATLADRDGRDAAAHALSRAAEITSGLAAAPLLQQIRLLARRARIPLAASGAGPNAGTPGLPGQAAGRAGARARRQRVRRRRAGGGRRGRRRRPGRGRPHSPRAGCAAPGG